MSPRRRIQTDVPETEDPDGCPRDGGSRRISPRRRIQTDVPETEDPDGCPRDGRPGADSYFGIRSTHVLPQ